MDNKRSGYRTKQKELILSCLWENRHRHVTADDIMAFLKKRGEAVGQTTIYRNLNRMVSDGLLLRYDAPGGAGACFQYLDGAEEHLDHYHLVCTDCGRVQHLSCEALAEISGHMEEAHRFRLNALKTIFYGLCEPCMKAAGRKSEMLSSVR